jgi:phosphatidylserine/phosphatidylglycerophosphate/cardiolipin synthase-like enzyme
VIEKQKEGINIEIIIANHEFNKKSRVDFKEFLKLNGKVGYIGKIEGGAKDKFMHHKFCIIDNRTIITGSYNWSYKARLNDENILVINNEPSLVKQFSQKFYEIEPQFGFAMEGSKVKILPIEKIMAKWNTTLPKKK